MLLLITNALVETLVKHMFNKYLNERDKIEIGGAPSWYMDEIDDQMCVFAHKSGGIDMIDVVKENARFKMIKKINGTIDVVVYENTKNITNEKEQAVVDRFKDDKKLPMFVDKNLNYSRVAFEDEIDSTFVRACIPKETIIEYQKDRLKIISKEVTKYKSKVGHSELDASLNGEAITDDPNDPFSELPK